MGPLTSSLARHARLPRLLILLVSAPLIGGAQFAFTTNNGALTVIGYAGSGGTIVIPEMTNGLPVTSIGDRSFESQRSLSSVVIPDSVTNIGISAFSGCCSLTNAALGQSLARIGDRAFERCISLTDVTIPGTTRQIGAAAFGDCTSMTKIIIPESVISIGAQAFYYCTSMDGITVEPLNPAYSSLEGVLFNHERTTLLQYPGGKAGAYMIPDTVTTIGDCAFMQCDKLSSAGSPSSVTTIGGYAFYGCSGLTDFTIPEGVTSIGLLAFSGCTGVASFKIPASVISIGLAAFTYCPRLQAITVADSNPSYSSLAGALLNKDQTTLIQCPGAKAGNYSVPGTVTNIGRDAFDACYSLTGIAIPNSVTCIGEFAFCLCTGLRELVIPESVTSIGQYAFDACTNLTGVYFNGNAPAAGYQPFYYVRNATVYYLPGTAGWEPLWGGVPTAIWQPRISAHSDTLGVRTNQFGCEVTWADGRNIVVEGCSDLARGNWSPLCSNTVVNGSFYFTDADWRNYPARFYRVRSL